MTEETKLRVPSYVKVKTFSGKQAFSSPIPSLYIVNISVKLITSTSHLSPDESYYQLSILQMKYLRNLTKSCCTVLEIEPKVWV